MKKAINIFAGSILYLFLFGCSYNKKETLNEPSTYNEQDKYITSDSIIEEQEIETIIDINVLQGFVINKLNQSKSELRYIVQGVGVENENVIIHLIKLSPNIVEEFKTQIIDSPQIIFRQTGHVEIIQNGGDVTNCDSCNIQIALEKTLFPIKSTSELKVEIINKRENSIDIDKYYIESYNGKGWDRIIMDGFFDQQIIEMVFYESTRIFPIRLYHLLYDYTPGTYRIFFKFIDLATRETFNLGVEFILQ